MEIGPIGCISSLGLEVLFGYRHGESMIFGWWIVGKSQVEN